MKQLELFNLATLDKRQNYSILPRYKKAVLQGFATLSTIDLFLAERGDFTSSIGDIKRVFDTKANLIARGYSFLVLLENTMSDYDDWHRRTYPVRTKKKLKEYVYDI